MTIWDRDDRLVVQVEFKLVHNNKNWQSQVDSAWADLYPAARSAKARLHPRLRVAVVGVVGKVYANPESGYPGECSDLDTWERELWSYTLPPTGDQYFNWIERAWKGSRHPIRSSVLARGKDHFFQLNLLAPTRGE